MNENKNTTTKNLWDSIKAELRGRFIAIHAYLETQEKNQINYLILHLKQLEQEEPQSQQEERNHKKIRSEINENETKETIAKINKLKAGSLRR